MSIHAPIVPNDGKPLRLVGAFIRRTTLDHASLVGANLTRADLTGASARGADFKDAIMNKTVLRGTDLTDARNMTIEQLSHAVIDEKTVLPEYINRSSLKQAMRSKRGNMI